MTRARCGEKKIHLEFGCKQGERSHQEEHRRFVESDEKACLTCARVCDCMDCHALRRDFGRLVDP